MRLVAFLVLVLVQCAVAAPGLEEHTFEQDGILRSYLVYRPRGRFEGPRALVVVLHGGGGTHRTMVGLTRYRFNRLADRDGFSVVYPQAVDKLWNFGEGRVSAGLESQVDDLAYFTTVLDEVSERFPIDPTRVFATGISRGGQACYFLAGKMPGRFRAIAPVTMPLPEFLADECKEGPPLGLALFNGTADPLVPYEGGWIELFGKKRDRVLSTDETIELWLQRNGCSGEATVETVDLPGDKTSVVMSSWGTVVLYRIENGGHTWPSGPQYLPVPTVGEVCRDIDAADEIWKFFGQF